MMSKAAIVFFLGITCVIAPFLRPGPVHSAVLLDRVVATVNEEVITWSELMSAISLDGKEYLNRDDGKTREEKVEELEVPFLNNLIDVKLQLQEARKIGLSVRTAEVEGAVREIRDKFRMTDEIFEKSLNAEGLTLDDYRGKLADQILIQKVVNVAVKKNLVVSDREIDDYYKEHSEKFLKDERLKLRQVFFAMPEDALQKSMVEAKADEVMRRLGEGEEFSELAAEFSEDPSRHYGGDIGYVSRGSILEEIENIAFLMEVGDVSRPFWSSAGLHIIKVEERAGGDLSVARDMISDTLFKKKFEEKYHSWRTGLREKAFVEIKL